MKHFIILLCLFSISCSNQVKFDLPQTSQNFAQDIKYNNKVDFLFVIDNTQSMNSVQKFLASQIPLLTDSLVSLKMDYHIGVVSTTLNINYPHSGKLLGEPLFLDSLTPNLNEQIKKKILIGEVGFTLEQGLDAMVKVLSEDYLTTEGKGFLRPDSFLNIIVLSNEDDQSKYPWNYYAEYLDKLRPDDEDGTKSWAMHFFGVLSLQDNCPSGDWSNYKSPGYKFLELVNYSSGVSESICGSSLYKSISGIKARVVQILKDYKLNTLPEVSTIRVYINDKLIPEDEVNGWTYIKSKNIIRFNGSSVPKLDDAIRVDFKPREAQ